MPEAEDPAAPRGDRPPEPWRLAAEARGLESRVREMLDTAERVAAERIDAARAAADAIVEAALREAEEIRRAARSGEPAPVRQQPREVPAPPRLRARIFVDDGDAAQARALAEELMLGGLGRVRIEAELHQRFPDLPAATLDAVLGSLLMPPAAGSEAAEGAA